MEQQYKPVRDSMIESVQKYTDDLLVDNVLPSIVNWLQTNKACTVTVMELASVAAIPQRSTPAPTPAPFQGGGFAQFPQNGAFGSLGGLPPQKSRVPREKKEADTDLSDPSWNDNFDENKCLYVPPRGTSKFKFCAATRNGDYPVCTNCTGKRGGVDIITRWQQEGYNFSPHRIRKEVTDKRLAEASKGPGTASARKTVGVNPAPNFNPVPAAAQQPANSSANVNYKAKNYTGSPTESGLYWLRDHGFVVKQGPAGLIAIGFAAADNEMYRSLSDAEKAKVVSLKIEVANSLPFTPQMATPQAVNSLPFTPQMATPQMANSLPFTPQMQPQFQAQNFPSKPLNDQASTPFPLPNVTQQSSFSALLQGIANKNAQQTPQPFPPQQAQPFPAPLQTQPFPAPLQQTPQPEQPLPVEDIAAADEASHINGEDM